MEINSNTSKTGLGITLKVKSDFQRNTGGSPANQLLGVTDILGSLTGTPTGATSAKVTYSDLTGNGGQQSSINNF